MVSACWFGLMFLSFVRRSCSSSWLFRHHFAIMMSLYLLLLIFIGAFNSNTFVSIWNKVFRWQDRASHFLHVNYPQCLSDQWTLILTLCWLRQCTCNLWYSISTWNQRFGDLIICRACLILQIKILFFFVWIYMFRSAVIFLLVYPNWCNLNV